MTNVRKSLSLFLLAAALSTSSRGQSRMELDAAVIQFMEAGPPSSVVRSHPTQGSVRHIIAPGMTVGKGTAADVVSSLFNRLKPLLGGEGVSFALESARYRAEAGPAFRYRQSYKGLPVTSGTYLIALTPSRPRLDGLDSRELEIAWDLALVSGRSFTEIDLPIVPTLSESEARVRGGATSIGASPGELSIHVRNPSEDASFELAWRFKTDDGFTDISADDGSIISSPEQDAGIGPHERGATPGFAKRFRAWQIPFTSELMNVYLTNPQLTGRSFGAAEVDDASPRVLSNFRAWVDPAAATTNPGAGFDFLPSDPLFDDVMAFYHTTHFRNYLAGILFTTQYAGPQIRIVTGSLGTGVNNAGTQIDFGMDALTGNSHAHEAAIVAHEGMHVFQRQWTGDGTWTNSNVQFSEKRALSESIADFMAIKYRLDYQGAPASATALGMHASFGGTPGQQFYLLRDMDNNADYLGPSLLVDYDQNSTEDQYDNSVVYSGALWEFQQSGFGGDVAGVVLKSLDYLTDGADNLEDGLAAMQAVVGSYWYQNGGIAYCPDKPPCLAYLNSAFLHHGIGGTGGPGPPRIAGNPSFGRLGSSPDLQVSRVGSLEVLAYPNPFNPTTILSVQIPESSRTTAEVYDMLGRRVALLIDGRLDAGTHEFRFDATGLPSGVYFYQVVSGADRVGGTINLVR